MSQKLYYFGFQQQILGTNRAACKYVMHDILAHSHQEAFNQWCSIPAIQDIEMSRLGELKISVTEAVNI